MGPKLQCLFNQKDDLGYTALHHAAIAGNVDVVSLLLEQGEAVDAKGQDGATPLRCKVYKVGTESFFG